MTFCNLFYFFCCYSTNCTFPSLVAVMLPPFFPITYFMTAWVPKVYTHSWISPQCCKSELCRATKQRHLPSEQLWRDLLRGSGSFVVHETSTVVRSVRCLNTIWNTVIYYLFLKINTLFYLIFYIYFIIFYLISSK